MCNRSPRTSSSRCAAVPPAVHAPRIGSPANRQSAAALVGSRQDVPATWVRAARMTIIEEAPTDEWRSGPLPSSSALDPGPAGVPALGRQLFHVARPHLLSRLDARHARLTVVSAPAGWGKTTLL